MDRIWQWAWDRYGPRYMWVIYAVTVFLALPVYLVLSFVIVAFEKSRGYIDAAAFTAAAVLALAYAMILPGLGESRHFCRWAAGDQVDPARALRATYAWTRAAASRVVGANAVMVALLFLVVGAVVGATGSRLASGSHLLCNRFATSRQQRNVLRQVTTANACRWFKTMTLACWPRRSTVCRPAWLSGYGFKRRSGRTSTRPWRPGCSTRVTTSSRASAGR